MLLKAKTANEKKKIIINVIKEMFIIMYIALDINVFR